jgi:hypothetical protein
VATVTLVVIFGTVSLLGLTGFVGTYYNALHHHVPLGGVAHTRAWLGLASAVLASLTLYQHLRAEPSRTPAGLAILTFLAYVLERAVAR